MYCKICGTYNDKNNEKCSSCGGYLQDVFVINENRSGKRCPRCGGYNCHPITDSTTTGKDFSAGNGCCGYLLFGPIGLLCGLCGADKKTVTKSYWVCPNCNNKFRL